MPAFSDLNDKIDFLFEAPTTDPATHQRDGVSSVWYLLRRKLIETAGYDPGKGDTEEPVDASGVRNRLFASLIVAFTGFHLVATFFCGDTRGVGERFRLA